MTRSSREIDTSVPPSGNGCVECLKEGGWWLHLRRCTQCGHIGCCDASPSQHATKHFQETGHPFITSYEPGETWFYDYRQDVSFDGPELAPPSSHPRHQPVPGPAGAVPSNWMDLLHD
jgi:hypothetical protein